MSRDRHSTGIDSLVDDEFNPLTFVDTIDLGSHVVLFYEDPEYGRSIEFRFIRNGMLKGEHCIYATHEDLKTIEVMMAGADIDIESNLLHTYCTKNLAQHPESLSEGFEKFIDTIFADARPPFRVVSILEVDTEDQMRANMEIEHKVHAAFEGRLIDPHYARLRNFPGSIMCPYSVDRIEPERLAELLGDILANHHAAIFAPKSSSGIGLNIR